MSVSRHQKTRKKSNSNNNWLLISSLHQQSDGIIEHREKHWIRFFQWICSMFSGVFSTSKSKTTNQFQWFVQYLIIDSWCQWNITFKYNDLIRLLQLISFSFIHLVLRRPTTLLLASPTSDLRKSVSHPSTSPCPLLESIPLKFNSVPELSLPPSKRLRPLTLLPSVTTTPTTNSVNNTADVPSLPRLISPSELAEHMKSDRSVTIFDCGSPIRYSEHHITKAILLPVANKISRKLFQNHELREFPMNMKQLNDSSMIILYDDQNHSQASDANRTAISLSPPLKCAYDEIRRCLTNSSSPTIHLLTSSFEQFFNVYPHLCESLKARSCPSSPINHPDNSSIPHTAPLIETSDESLHTHPMTHIIDGLFIGSESNAKNLNELTSEDIRHIVNVTSHVPLYHRDLLQYCHIPADDSQKQNLLDYFDQAYGFIHDAIQKNEKVLVHCVAGISRSPAIVIGFLMRYAKMTMNEAYNFVKRKRNIVSPNLNFMGQLLEYEKKLKHSS